MGTWRDGLNLVNSKLFGNDFSDFGNRTLTIATKPVSESSSIFLSRLLYQEECELAYILKH